MHIFLNALGASCSSGLTYLRNVIPQLLRHAGIRTTLAVSREFREEFGRRSNLACLQHDFSRRAARRFWQEQTMLPGLIRRSGADVLISAGNFALWRSPVPQILLSGNALYTCGDFIRDLRARGEYGLLLDTIVRGFLARRSAGWADATVAPSEWFAEQIRRWTGADAVCIHHGFDPAVFFADSSPLPMEIQKKLDAEHALRLLFVSHYNYYRNFETLLRAVPMVRERLGGRKVRLLLTCELQRGRNPGSYRPERAEELVRDLGISEEVVELGTIPYGLLHQVYRACDIYVTPAYAETFAHPLVEAMENKLPIVASDLPVHREICGSAALYFPRFSPDELAEQILRLARSTELRAELSFQGLTRVRDFSWAKHVNQLRALAAGLIRDREPSFAEQRLIA